MVWPNSVFQLFNNPKDFNLHGEHFSVPCAEIMEPIWYHQYPWKISWTVKRISKNFLEISTKISQSYDTCTLVTAQCTLVMIPDDKCHLQFYSHVLLGFFWKRLNHLNPHSSSKEKKKLIRKKFWYSSDIGNGFSVPLFSGTVKTRYR